MNPRYACSNALCPTYAASDRERPELIGSGTLLDFGKARVLVTAAHVHDWYTTNEVELYTFGVVDGAPQQVQLPQPFIKTNPPASRRRADDKFDFAFVRLDDPIANQIAALRYFLPFSLIDANDRLHPMARYMFTGYPLSREKTNYGQRRVAPKAYSLTEVTTGTTVMARFGFHPETHIAVNYRRQEVKDDGGKVAHFPSAKGMSGGPVWRGDGDSKRWLKTTPVRLVGIGIEDRENDGLMIAVRIHLITAAIGDCNPDIRSLTPRRKGFDYSGFVFSGAATP
jgi:hypothetical protein